MAAPTLPAGLTTRPLTQDDARVVFELMAAQELADLGTVEIEEADIVSDWARPSYDVGSSTVGVFDGDTMVGYADLTSLERSDAAVLPTHRGRGIGTWLAHWLQDKARERGSTIVGMPTPEGSPGDRLMTDLGYHVRWNSWVLQVPAGQQIPHRDVPDGYTVREGTTDDLRAAHNVIEDAFLEWSRRDREDFEDFLAETTGRPGWEPWNLRVVTDPGGDVVAVSVVFAAPESSTAYVSRLATRKDQRGRGLAQALLIDSFEQGRLHGMTTSELSTDSRTGALSLYEKVGMVVTSNWVHRAINL